jgi:hypothetical protein
MRIDENAGDDRGVGVGDRHPCVGIRVTDVPLIRTLASDLGTASL